MNENFELKEISFIKSKPIIGLLLLTKCYLLLTRALSDSCHCVRSHAATSVVTHCRSWWITALAAGHTTFRTTHKWYIVLRTATSCKNWVCYWKYFIYLSRWMRWSHGYIRLSTRCIDQCLHLGLSMTSSWSRTLHKTKQNALFFIMFLQQLFRYFIHILVGISWFLGESHMTVYSQWTRNPNADN